MSTIDTIPQLPFCPAPIEVVEFYGPNGVEGACIARLPFVGRCRIHRSESGHGWVYETCNASKHGKRTQLASSYGDAVLSAWKWACRRVRQEQRKAA